MSEAWCQVNKPKTLSKNLSNTSSATRLLPSLDPSVPSHAEYPQKRRLAAESRGGVRRQSLRFQGRKGARAKFEGERLLAESVRWHGVLRRQR